MNEQFSAFLDNEASRDESDAVINALLRDEALRESWSRQHWLRTTLRAHSSEIAVALDPQFSARVMQAIAADDAPAAAPTIPVDGPVPVDARRGTWRRRWRSMAGVAAAASAAGFVLLVSNPLQRDDEMQPMQPMQVSTANSAVTAQPAKSEIQVASNGLSGDMLDEETSTPARQGPADHWSVSDPALEDELNSYLVEHNGLARGYGLSGTTPGFVRVATYGQETPQ